MAEATLTEKSGVVTFTLLIDGAQASPPHQIISIVVVREVNKIPFCRLVMLDGDSAIQDFETSASGELDPGKEVEVLCGYNSEEKTVFKGVIIKHRIKVRESDSYLIIECRDQAVKMTSLRKSKYFYESKDSDIIDEILGEYGLESDVEPTDVTHPEMVQYNAKDWDFINSRAEVNGKVVLVKNGKVTVKKPDDGAASNLLLEYGTNIIEFEAEADARDQWSEATGARWDPATQEMVVADGADSGPRELGALDPTTLAEVVNQASQDFVHAGQATEDELKALADASLLKSKLAKVRGWVKFQGIEEVEIGDFIELGGLGDAFNGNAFVSAVKHEIGDGNWMTLVQFGLAPEWFYQNKDVNSPPALGLVPSVSGLHIGIVTQLEADPDSEERIMVKVPAISTDEDGIWARLATLDAGDSRGSVFRPEIDDEVVLGYLDDDPRNPVVLGMLHSSSKPSPIPATNDNHEKGIVTRGEMKIVFNDDVNSMELSTPNGNLVSLSEEEGAILIEDENGNKVEMTADGITIDSSKDLILKAAGDITIEGTNISTAASAEFKAEGGAGAELSSGATAVLKGSLVQIN